MEALTIGKVAKSAGVGIETIRFYEREGLIPEPPRKESGYRQYPEEAVKRLLFIRHAKDLGFTLKEVRELLSLRAEPRKRCTRVRRKAEDKVADIDQRIGSLRKMRAALLALINDCAGRGSRKECPILDVLDTE